MQLTTNIPLKIMVVDDDPDILFQLTQSLEILSYNVVGANSGEQAIKLFEQSPVDILVTDLRMPNMDGLELMDRVLSIEEETVVIIISGQDDLKTAISFMKHGASDFLLKPIKLAEFEASIEAASKTSQLLKDRRYANKLLQKKNEELEKEIQAHKKAKLSLQEIQAKQHALIQSIPEGIISIDISLKIIQVNNALNKICPISQALIENASIHQLLDTYSCECLKVLSHCVNTHQTVREFQINCVHSEEIPQRLVLNSSPIRIDGVVTGILLVIRDITKIELLENQLNLRSAFKNIVGKSERMRRVFSLINQLSDMETTVLITGESGTGKELVAEALHFNSHRCNDPLIKVNCSVLSEHLLESEIFGHVRGSFTGAIKDRVGRFQAANGGSIFLDEIGDVSPLIQLKLLRFLDTKEFERVGDNKTQRADVRIITATNQNLEELVKKNAFREDFYYRLNVMSIHIPALRERYDDLDLLIDYFCHHFGKIMNKRFSGVTDSVVSLFLRYSWPGNIRELKHVLEHACILCSGGTISEKFLPPKFIQMIQSPNLGHIKSINPSNLTKEEIITTLNQCKWNKTKTAGALGIHRRTLYRKMNQMGINRYNNRVDKS